MNKAELIAVINAKEIKGVKVDDKNEIAELELMLKGIEAKAVIEEYKEALKDAKEEKEQAEKLMLELSAQADAQPTTNGPFEISVDGKTYVVNGKPTNKIRFNGELITLADLESNEIAAKELVKIKSPLLTLKEAE